MGTKWQHQLGGQQSVQRKVGRRVMAAASTSPAAATSATTAASATPTSAATAATATAAAC